MKYNFIYIRDISIPNNKVDHVKKFLLQYENEKSYLFPIEELLGCAIYYSNIVIISYFNLYIIEHKIKIDKLFVLKSIFYAKCRDDYSKEINKDICICYRINNNILRDYIERYWNIFS